MVIANVTRSDASREATGKLQRALEPDAIQQQIGLDLDRVAIETGAVQRWRKIENGMALLLTCIASAMESLRVGAAAVTTHTGWRISDTAVHKRVARAVPFLQAVLAALLQRNAGLDDGNRPALGRPVRFVDATHASLAGSNCQTVYRLHAVYSADHERLVDIEITRDDSDGTERLQRAPHPVGSLVVGDRGLARTADLAALVGRGAHALVRAPLHNLRLARRDPAGEADGKPVRWTRDEILETIVDRKLEIGEAAEWPVHLLTGSPRQPDTTPARLIAIRLSPSAHKTELEKVEAGAKRHGHALQPATRQQAAYLLLVTTLPDGELDAATLGRVYRVRWQIETYFKHLKTDFGIDEVRARNEDSVRAFLLSMLIVAVLNDRVAEEEVFSPR